MFNVCYLKSETNDGESSEKVWRGCLTHDIIVPVLFVSRETPEEMKNFVKRWKLWKKKNKKCLHCCIFCRYWQECYFDFMLYGE